MLYIFSILLFLFYIFQQDAPLDIRVTEIYKYLFPLSFTADSELVCADLLGLEAYSRQEDFTQRFKSTGSKTGTAEGVILSRKKYA